MIKTMQDIVSQAKISGVKKMVVAVANDDHVLEAVEMARKEHIINAILVGDEQKILDVLNHLNIPKDTYEIINEPDVIKACDLSVKLVSSGKADLLMKGLVDTSIILKSVLDKDFGLRTPNRLSHVSIMEIPLYHKLIMMSDGAMNMYPDVDIKQEIIENGVEILKKLGVKQPKVACICAIEKVNPKMQNTVDCQELVERNKNGRIKNCIVGGPFALDNAINKEAAIHKGVTDPMTGDVDFLLMPQIESGNVFYKAMMFLAQAKSAGVIAGAQKPIVLTSRADSKETKFYSIAFAQLISKV